MIRNILLIGKDFLVDEGFISQCKMRDVPFVCTTKVGVKTRSESVSEADFDEDSTVEVSADATGAEDSLFESLKTIVPWNRSSSLSAKNLIIRAESMFDYIDRAVLVFDTYEFLEQYSSLEKNVAQTIAAELVVSYQQMTEFLLERFRERRQGGLVFLLKEMTPLFKDNKSLMDIDSPGVFAAQEAFVAFAEMVTYKYSQGLRNSIVLSKTKLQDDADVASLLFDQLESEKTEKKLQRDRLSWLVLQNQSESPLRFFR